MPCHIEAVFHLHVLRCLGKPTAVELRAREFVDEKGLDVAAFLVKKADLEAVEARDSKRRRC